MRKYYLISIIFFSLSSQFTALNYFPLEVESDTNYKTLSFLDLYPLHIGNYWQYKVTVDSDFNNEDTVYYRYREILKDTLMSNGEIYKKIFDGRDFAFQTYTYLRVDSTTGCIYIYSPNGNYTNDELLRDSLKMMMGDSFLAEDWYPIMCTLVDSVDSFGEVRLRKHYYFPLIPIYSEYRYTEGIGETYRMNHFEFIVALNIFSEITYARINGEEFGELVNVENEQTEKYSYKLSQNYPNHFNPITKINYQLPERSFVTLKIYDVLGNEIAILINEEKPAGEYEVDFNSTGLIHQTLPSGVYFYRLQADSFVKTKKMVLLR